MQNQTVPGTVRKYVFLLQETVQKQPSPKYLVWGRIVKTKIETIIGTKLSSDNVLVTDAWRAYKTYAKEKGLEHY